MRHAEVLTPERLKETREAMGMTQAELAGWIGVSNHTIRRWEGPGAVIPRIAEIAFLSVIEKWKEEVKRGGN